MVSDTLRSLLQNARACPLPLKEIADERERRPQKISNKYSYIITKVKATTTKRRQPSWRQQCLRPWWTRRLHNQFIPSPSRRPINHQKIMSPTQLLVKQLQSAGPHQQLHLKSLFRSMYAPKSPKRQRFISSIGAFSSRHS